MTDYNRQREQNSGDDTLNKAIKKIIPKQARTAKGTRNQQQQNQQGQYSGGNKRNIIKTPKPAKRTPMRRRRNPLPRKAVYNVPPLAPNTIRIVPLGGTEEIGRNMTLVEYNDQIIVIDAGIEFTDADTPGVDYIIPNTTYLEERKHLIKAVVITHGHLDHIGALPYLIEKIGNPPIYCREFGALLIKRKLAEFPQLPPINIKIVEKDDGSLKITDDLSVTFFGLTHSIPDSTGVIIETPFGDIISTGDVRVENIDGIPVQKEIDQYKFLADRNVLLMTMDSTGITDPGWSQSEERVLDNLDEIIRTAKGRIILATFASQVERIISILESAKKYGRVVVIEGRSMKMNVSIVEELKLTDLSHIIEPEYMDDYPPHKLIMIATGGQGEEFAALSRIANKTHKSIRLTSLDTVILSSSIIPGNEAAIDKLKDNLYRSDAHVLTYIDSMVHASGHGRRDELAWIHTQIPYKYFMPIHGHHYRLKMHKELAIKLGAQEDRVIVPDNGSIIEISNNGDTIILRDEKVPAEKITIDGTKISERQELVLRDRKILANDGIFVIVATLNMKTKKLKKSPDIISRGFVYLKEERDLLKDSRNLVKRLVEGAAEKSKPIDFDRLKDDITKKLTQFLFQKTQKEPLIIPVVIVA
ncbi:MAG: ribonuclease J [Flavobacteriaceae bacterium]|jgi:ribonuclease J